ncbi:hypothetical protein [Chitinophaga sp. RAB17]|uniref:hypothetical protein n=1 Tax=Chitinophaga sp. RAB17 TaxID=3233049 RepID=UPI003F92E8E2
MKTSDSTITLLDYAINTTPDPLQAGPQNGNTMYAALILVVSNGGNAAVNLESIQVTIPPDLTNNLESILYNADPQRVWSITPASPGVFNILPVSGKPVTITTEGVVFQFFNIAVSQVVGTVQIGIIETASSSAAGSDDRFVNIPVTKFPYGFFFSNFTPQIPLVQDNQTVTLTWEGSSQAKYAMYYNNEVVDVTNVRKWTSKPITNDVTFLLRAIVVSQGETVIKDLTTTVIVANPQIQADTLQVSGNAQLLGNVSLGASGTTLKVTGNSNLPGNVTIGKDMASQLTLNARTVVNGEINILAPLIVNARTDFFSLKVSNNMQVLNANISNLSCPKIFTEVLAVSGAWKISVDRENASLVFSFLNIPMVIISQHGVITSMTYGSDNELLKTQVLNG